MAAALPVETPFPDIPFDEFSQFIKRNFSSSISLASVLCLLFSMTENPELLTLHARQQNPRVEGENRVSASGWIKCLSRSIQSKLCEDGSKLLKESDEGPNTTEDQIVTTLSMRLDALAKLLKLNPCSKSGKIKQKLKPVSYKAIEAVHVVCPDSFQCETLSCKPRSLQQITRLRDIPLVTLIKGFTIYENCPVLTGQCPECNATYYADHERAPVEGGQQNYTKVYLNSAKYLKIGQNIWVDRLFSNAVLSGIYNFHASAAAFTEFWNDAVWKMQPGNSPKLSRRQIWHTFVQESIRSIACSFGLNLELYDGLNIDQVTQEAFKILGERGIIRFAEGHNCSECTQKYKSRADQISLYDSAAIVGMDEDSLVPGLEVEIDEDSLVPRLEVDVSEVQETQTSQPTPTDENADVRMVVIDGLVVGSSVCFQVF